MATTAAEHEPAVAEAAIAAAQTRERSEVEAMIATALANPRDETEARAGLMRACGRFRFAETARYVFRRGNAQVEGPSVHLAKEAARHWRNIRYGLRVISVVGDTVHIKAFAVDLETNLSSETEDRFKRRIQRKIKGKTVWITIEDERELRELINRRGAIALRNAILCLVPEDVIEDAMGVVRETLREAASEQAAVKDPREAVGAVAAAFAELDVSRDMLVAFVGRPLDRIGPDDLQKLREVYRSIAGGHTSPADHFGVPETPGRSAGPPESPPPGARKEAQAGLSAEEQERQAVRAGCRRLAEELGDRAVDEFAARGLSGIADLDGVSELESLRSLYDALLALRQPVAARGEGEGEFPF